MNEMHGLKFSINIGTSAAPTYAELREGVDNMQEAMNEVVNQFKFMSDEGFSRSRVSGAAPIWTLSGRRVYGDAAQDFIFDSKYELGAAREADAKVEFTEDGLDYAIAFDCTFANLQEFSGATTDIPAMTVEVHVNGKPTVTKTAHA